LAYLLFPFIVLVLWRLRRSLPTWGLLVAWIVVLLPLIAYGLNTTDSYYTDNWGSTIRVLTEFIAGGITYLVVSRLHPGLTGDPSPTIERIATWLTIILPSLVVIGSVILATPHRMDWGARTIASRTHKNTWHSNLGTRWLYLVLALHDPLGVVRTLARRHESSRY
jgi:peptidoglycan/LPS O-acetylase OafA/YrhL